VSARTAAAALAIDVTWVVAVWAAQAPAASLDTTYFDAAMHPAIQYFTRPGTDPIARLARAMDAGTERLQFDPRSGYLPSLLRALDVQLDSQVVVFSKTSLQAALIGPRNPRAIYFNDSVVVAWPRGGHIEVATQDPVQGVAFYMLEQRETATPRFVRPGNCLTCHLSYATLNVPGLLMRSVATAADGRPLPQLTNDTLDHRTPMEERWAGWYITGNTGSVRHLGNTAIANPDGAGASVSPAASALASLDQRFDTTGYLTSHSDAAALLVFTHQMHMMNLLTRVGWETRVALADRRPDAERVIASAAADLVDYLLFVDEPALTSPVTGSTGFAGRFAAAGPRDRDGRSLRQLDLRTRLLRYPCSYMIYSEAFDAMPKEALDAVYARLWQVLSGAETAPRYARLSPADRRAITEILRETKQGLPPSFNSLAR